MGTAVRPLARPPSGALLPRRCAATGSGLARKGRGAKVARGLRVASFTEPPRPDFAAYPRGRGQCPRAFSPPHGGGTGPLVPGACVDRGGLSSVRLRPRRAARAGIGPRKGCSRSAARSATHPTRLVTRTKESNARASQRVSPSPHGAMKVKAGARRPRWDPPAPAGGAPPARLARTAGQVELERVRWYPKDGELCLGRAKPGETLVEARSGPDVQIGRPTWV